MTGMSFASQDLKAARKHPLGDLNVAIGTGTKMAKR